MRHMERSRSSGIEFKYSMKIDYFTIAFDSFLP